MKEIKEDKILDLLFILLEIKDKLEENNGESKKEIKNINKVRFYKEEENN